MRLLTRPNQRLINLANTIVNRRQGILPPTVNNLPPDEVPAVEDPFHIMPPPNSNIHGQPNYPNSIQDVFSQLHDFDEKPPSDENYPPVFNPPKLSEYPDFTHKPQPTPKYRPRPIQDYTPQHVPDFKPEDYKPHPIPEILTPIHPTTKKPKKKKKKKKKIVYKVVNTKAPKVHEGTTKKTVYKLVTEKPKTTAKPTQSYHHEVTKKPVIKHMVWFIRKL